MLRFAALFLTGLLLAGVFSEEKVKEKKAAVYPTEDAAADAVLTNPVKFPGRAYPPGFYQHANAYYPPSGLYPGAYANAANAFYRGPLVRPGAVAGKLPLANRPLAPVNPFVPVPGVPVTAVTPVPPAVPGFPSRYQGTIPPFVPGVPPTVRPGFPYPGSPYYPGNPDYPEGYDPIHNYPNTIPGVPGVDYPVFSFIPPTGFKCDPNFPGFYADLDTACQVWHYCQLDGRQDSFLCPNGTIFNQKYFVCDWHYNVDCGQSQSLYVLNDNLYKEGHGIHGFQGIRPGSTAPGYIPPLHIAPETDALEYIRSKKDSPKA